MTLSVIKFMTNDFLYSHLRLKVVRITQEFVLLTAIKKLL